MKLKINHMLIAALTAAFFLMSCESKTEDESMKQYIALYTILNSSRSGSNASGTTTNITCNVAAPAFSSLAQAGTTTSCAKSGCHDTGTKQSGLDMSDRTTVVTRVISGNPDSSLLFQKVTTGTMAVNTTTNITNAIYCWIKGGANP
ncbi:MAG: hypothetical protein K8R21_14280 [Leptospira sp.]|nr:hypothetical protein [Leptospira sp.]